MWIYPASDLFPCFLTKVFLFHSFQRNIVNAPSLLYYIVRIVMQTKVVARIIKIKKKIQLHYIRLYSIKLRMHRLSTKTTTTKGILCCTETEFTLDSSIFQGAHDRWAVALAGVQRGRVAPQKSCPVWRPATQRVRPRQHQADEPTNKSDLRESGMINRPRASAYKDG